MVTNDEMIMSIEAIAAVIATYESNNGADGCTTEMNVSMHPVIAMAGMDSANAVHLPVDVYTNSDIEKMKLDSATVVMNVGTIVRIVA